MNKFEIGIISDTVILLLYVCVHIAASRLAQPNRRWLLIKRLFFPALLIASGTGYTIGKSQLLNGTSVFGIISSLLIIGLIHIGYLTVYAVFDRSITLRTMIEMDSRPEALTYQQIEALYDPTSAFERRLQILVESGFLSKINDQYVLTPKGTRTGKFIRFLKDLYKFGEGG